MKRRGRLLSIALAICLAAGLLPTTALAVPGTGRTARTASTRSTGTASWIVDATKNPSGGIQGYDDTKKDEPSKGYHYIYFGSKDGAPLKWRVLDAQTSGGTSGGIFLLSEGLFGKKAFNSGSGNAWQGSTAQDWCKEFAGESGTTSPFAPEERAAFLGVTHDGSTNEKVFFLSEEEAKKKDYGLDTNASRVAKDGDVAMAWWLRTAGTGGDEAKAIDKNGALVSEKTDSELQARPAFNLDMSKVLFTAPAAGTTTRAAGGLNKVSAAEVSEWRLVLKDDGRNASGSGFTAKPDGGNTGDPVPVDTGGTVTLQYDNAKTGANEYVSAILEDDAGNLLYYGQVKDCSAADSDNGTVPITVPTDLASGSYKLKVFNEQYNGAKQTGYASNFSNIDITVTDTTPPELTTDKEGERTSGTEATVTFTASEAGAYYYEVVKKGDAPPTINATGTGNPIPADALTQTLKLDNLTPGQDYVVYIVMKDLAGNPSKNPPLTIEIPAGVTPTYDISVSPVTLDFQATEGYGPLAGKKVTIKNTGNQPITLTQPVVPANSNYVIGTLSKTTLIENEEAEFIVSPKNDLDPGIYSEKITVSGSNGSHTATKEVTLNFEVTARTPGKHVITASAGEGGTITPRRSEVDPGADLTVTITPRTGYEIDTVTVDGAEIAKSNLSERNEYTFTNIQADHAIHVTFKAIDDGPLPTMRTLTVSASPETGGKAAISGSDNASGTYEDGTSVMVTATANEGYHFVRWTENGNEVSTSASYTFGLVANKNLVAVFEADPVSHTVTVNSSYAQTSGAGTYQAGATVTVQAGTRQNYRFDGWTTEDGVTFENASSATTTFTMPDKDVTVAAKWTYTGSTGTNNGTNSGNNGTTSGGNNTTSGTNSGGNGTVSDGKEGAYTGDDTPTAMWMSSLCTSFGLMTVLGVLGWRRRKLYPEMMGQWRGLTEKEFGQKKR